MTYFYARTINIYVLNPGQTYQDTVQASFYGHATPIVYTLDSYNTDIFDSVTLTSGNTLTVVVKSTATPGSYYDAIRIKATDNNNISMGVLQGVIITEAQQEPGRR